MSVETSESTIVVSGGRSDLAWAGAVAALSLSVFLLSPVTQAGDQRFALLLADQLWTSRSFDLAPRIANGADPALATDGAPEQLLAVGPHLRTDYSPASAILSTPFVPLLRAGGWRITGADGAYDPAAEIQGQRVIAGIVSAATAAVFFLMARTVLGRGSSLLIALGGALGTPMWSTASRALWSHTWALSLASLGLLVLLRALSGAGRFHPALLGGLWGAAFLVRPSFAIGLVGVAILLARVRPRALAPFAAAVAVALGALAVLSHALYASWVPPYLQPSQLAPRQMPTAIAGLWLSPSRGLAVFVPVVLFVAYATFRHPPREALRPLRHLALAVVAAHTLATAADPLWWGGHCYGPRALADVVPWLVLLAILALDGTAGGEGARLTPLERASALGLAALGILIHARGATAAATQEWNYRPRSVDVATERLWDWRRPQALAGWLSLDNPDGAPGLALGQAVDLRTPENEAYLGAGWSVSEPEQRWALGPAAHLAFGLAGTSDGVLRLEAEPFLVPGRLDAQEVGIELNGQPIGTWRMAFQGFRTYSIRLPRSLQAPQDRLRLRLPDARMPHALGQGEDRRRLGIAVRTLRVDALPVVQRGRAVSFAGAAAQPLLGAGWGEPEPLHRWTDGPQAEVWFAAQDDAPAVLRLVVAPFLPPGYRDRQRIRVELNGWTAAEQELTDPSTQALSVVLPSGALAADNLLRIHLPDAPTAPPADPALDPRRLGVAVESLTIEDLPRLPDGAALVPQAPDADPFLVEGWAWEDASRPSRRWALGPAARLAFATEQTAARVLRLDLEPFLAPALGEQRVRVTLNGVPLAALALRREVREAYPLALPPGTLARHNVMVLELPDARSPRVLGLGADARRLGVVVRSIAFE